MTEHVPNMDQPLSGDPAIDEVRADIAATRAELQDTVDAIGSKLNVRARGRKKATEGREKVSDAAARVKDSAPEPVQHAVDRAVETAAPAARQVAAKAGPHRVQILGGAIAAVAIVLVVRRRRNAS